MSESQALIEADNVPDVRPAFGQTKQHLEANRGFSSQEAREWIPQEARAKKASMEAVVQAAMAGTEVEYRPGPFPRGTSLPALVLSYDGPMDLGSLTARRCKAALPFAGKYRLIDFVLSNCVNSGIEIVGVITQHQPRTLNAHLAHGRPWGLDRREGGLTLLHPYQTCRSSVRDSGIDWYTGTAHAIHQNQDFVVRNREDQTLILYGSEIYTMDLQVLAAQHRHTEADLTVAVATVETGTASRYHTLIVDREGRIRELLPAGSDAPSPLAVMGVLLFSTDALSRQLNGDSQQVNSTRDLISDVIADMIQDGDRVMAFHHVDYWKQLHTAYDYWQASMDLLHEGWNWHDASWPIHTQAEIRPPTRISKTAKVKHSLVSEGCIIHGTVEYSILSPGVYVAPGAIVRNAVIMHNTRIEESARVENAILDVGVLVEPQAEVGSAQLDTLPQILLERCPIAVVPQGRRVLAEETARAAALSRYELFSLIEGR